MSAHHTSKDFKGKSFGADKLVKLLSDYGIYRRWLLRMSNESGKDRFSVKNIWLKWLKIFQPAAQGEGGGDKPAPEIFYPQII